MLIMESRRLCSPGVRSYSLVWICGARARMRECYRREVRIYIQCCQSTANELTSSMSFSKYAIAWSSVKNLQVLESVWGAMANVDAWRR